MKSTLGLRPSSTPSTRGVTKHPIADISTMSSSLIRSRGRFISCSRLAAVFAEEVADLLLFCLNAMEKSSGVLPSLYFAFTSAFGDFRVTFSSRKMQSGQSFRAVCREEGAPFVPVPHPGVQGGVPG